MHNVTTVIGIDEVGRGAWAGPLVVGAVLLEEPIDGLRDSKLISKKEREQLEQTIRSESSFVGLGWVLPKEVDDLGLTKALQLGCVRALSNAPSNKNIIIDGGINFLPDIPNCQNMIKADTHIPAVSAASIVAKVARDNYMAALEVDYPGYGFASHVGYGTKKHVEAIRQFGITILHRRSYKPIRKLAYET